MGIDSFSLEKLLVSHPVFPDGHRIIFSILGDALGRKPFEVQTATFPALH
jgi:hypothetical protein